MVVVEGKRKKVMGWEKEGKEDTRRKEIVMK